MAILQLPSFCSLQSLFSNIPLSLFPPCSNDFPRFSLHQSLPNSHRSKPIIAHSRSSNRFWVNHGDDDDEDDAKDCSFDEAVELFNDRRYYECHDLLEILWNEAEDPTRTLIHGVLQCAVGLHHLFNMNHRGAMMELGEGVCKLRKMNFKSGPFHQLERDISAVLDFLYQTQIELAACTEEVCVAMDQTERSYQLLGGYAAGQQVYGLEKGTEDDTVFIVFNPKRSFETVGTPRARLPTLKATKQHLLSLDNNGISDFN